VIGWLGEGLRAEEESRGEIRGKKRREVGRLRPDRSGGGELMLAGRCNQLVTLLNSSSIATQLHIS